MDPNDTEVKTCSICEEEIYGYGHNPQPVIIEGKKLPSKGLPKNIREGLDRIKVISKTLEDSNASLRVQVDLLNVKDLLLMD